MELASLLGVSEQAEKMLLTCEDEIEPLFAKVQEMAQYNQARVLKAFADCGIQAAHFVGSSGYGYDDIGRDTLEKLFAKTFGCEDAIVRPQIVSGTHALAIALQGMLEPGQTICYVSGKPYDTLEQVIGLEDTLGSLMRLGIHYKQIELLPDGGLDYSAVQKALQEDGSIAVVAVQRSAGYAWRRSLHVSEIAKLADLVHAQSPDTMVFVDNCYGEFTEAQEPVGVGADVMAGSLIKNPGGGIAPTGGYIAGTKRAIDRIEHALTAPGIGRACGSYEASYRPFYQGFFLAPTVTASAVKTAILFAKVFSKLGYEVNPAPEAMRSDIIQSIAFHAPDPLLAFCRSIQKASPVDSMATPEPWAMPGYTHEVVMAAGAFVQGSSIELSADAPMAEPYICYFQGGLTYEHGRIGCLYALDAVLRSNQIK